MVQGTGIDLVESRGAILHCRPRYPLNESLVAELSTHFCADTHRILEIDLRECVTIKSTELGVLALLKTEPLFESPHARLIICDTQVEEMVRLVGLESYYTIVAAALDLDTLQSSDSIAALIRFEKLQLQHDLLRREKEQLEDQIIHLQRTSEVGQLAAGVAHEFNNILMGMKGWAQLALDADEEDVVLTALATVNDLTDRAKRITGDLLSFSRKNRPVKILADINGAVRQTITFLSSQFMLNNITCEVEYGKLEETAFDSSQLEQVFVNIMTNAMHAIQEERGVIKISTSCEEGVISVRIADDGAGIPPENLKNIFVPFFTTKGARGGGKGDGTGLGLAVSRGIILGHGGDIEVKSVEGRGTVFTITLPVVSGLKVEAPADPPAVLHGGPLHVLIVDDELTLRKLLIKYLSAKGHQVYAVSNGEEAINYCRANEPDVILLDMLMPGINGADTYIELKRLLPTVRTAVITGHAGSSLDAMLKLMRHTGSIELIRKPARLADILAFVEKGRV